LTKAINFLAWEPSNFRTSTHSAQHPRLDACQLSRFCCNDQWPPIWPDLNPLDYHVWGAIMEAYHKLKQSRKQSPNSRKRFSWSGTNCHTDRLKRLLKTSQSDWRPVLNLVMDTSNIQN